MDPGHDDEQRRAIIIIATYALFGLGNALALVSLGIRMHVKTGTTKKLGVDDGEYDLAFLVLHLGLSLTSAPGCSLYRAHMGMSISVLLPIHELPAQPGHN